MGFNINACKFPSVTDLVNIKCKNFTCCISCYLRRYHKWVCCKGNMEFNIHVQQANTVCLLITFTAYSLPPFLSRLRTHAWYTELVFNVHKFIALLPFPPKSKLILSHCIIKKQNLKSGFFFKLTSLCFQWKFLTLIQTIYYHSYYYLKCL